ncbi:MAG: hypothetical protein FIA89_00855 [Geobacter sp.]|nr:hypothetical protein [Geobacter sp.]
MWLLLLVSAIVSNIYGGWWWVATYLCIVLVCIKRRPPFPSRSRAGQDGILVEYDAPAPEHGSDSSWVQRSTQVVSWSWFMRAGVDLPFACTMDERTGEKVFWTKSSLPF